MRYFVAIGRFFKKPWMRIPLLILSLILFAVVVWIGGPLIGFGESRPFASIWVRIAIIATVLLIFAIVWFIRWRRARKGAEELEEALIPQDPVGDGAVLGERMTEALSTLKASGGKSYLYDLPWYVIIGPPGAGKTTALLNSGIKFPLAEKSGAAMEGFGGTRYCDWWFAEEAVMIDTAGRYTSQDSDAEADKTSWQSFLELLKRGRTKQPINGVILAFSVEDIMSGSPEELTRHAEVVRARLAEIHETLKIDFPVYVLFTKSDLIAGFREYFSSFSASRRQKVWGTTFQTKSRSEQTHTQVGEEFDALVARLSDEVMDRLSEEPDGVNRIAIFGLPGQMAMMRDNISSFLGQVFEPTRYKTNALLRGFYFSSGTQEGTPIDQVLGAMGRSFGADTAMAGGFMSGKGKSFFLHDLLKHVIFPEQGWVTYDRKAVNRANGLRIAGFTLVGLATLGLLGAWGYSYWANASLVRSAQAAMADYELAAREELQEVVVDDTDFQTISGYLQLLRDMPTGFASTQEVPEQIDTDGDGELDAAASGGDDDHGILEGFGLSRREQLQTAARASYADGLERMFRPRLVLRLEEQLAEFVQTNQTLAIYEGLKVYKLLGGVAPAPEDDLVRGWFREDFNNLYPGPTNRATRQDLEAHLLAMLEMDGDRDVRVDLDSELVDAGERILARMSVSDQAYALIKATVEFSGVQSFNLVDRVGPDSYLVFETVDGSDLGELGVNSLYTYDGFQNFFLDQLSEVAGKLDREQWVMGDYAETAKVDAQLSGLGRALLTKYREDYLSAWEGLLNQLKLAPMSADKPAYASLAAASSPTTSPLLKLVEAVSRETKLTVDPSEGLGLPGDGADVAGAVSGLAESEAAAQAADQIRNRFINRTNGLTRIGLTAALGNGKSQRRAGVAGGGGGGESQALIPGAAIEAQFAEWHALLEAGSAGTGRPIDALLGNLGQVQQNLVIAAGFNATQAAAQLPVQIGILRSTASRLPTPLARMVNEAVEDFEGDAANTTIAQLNQDLTNQVTRVCNDIITGRYPFNGPTSRQVPMAQFARVFAPDGVMDRFFLQHLSPHADQSSGDWKWSPESQLGDRLSLGTLKQFQRAARIKDAFFPAGGSNPELEVTVSQESAHDQVRQAVLEVNGQVITTRQVGNVPQTIKWPSAGSSTTLQFLPGLNGRQSSIQFDQGPWAFMQFVRAGSPRQQGDATQVRYTIGGRYVSYSVRVNALYNPFTLRELSEFKCPQGL
ncbi:type VI secretion system membrane subunit TssM [Litoreibacter halocynthiae]|uniref:type VI secretion system membrane subunit TssM n=1 Tax=Litoreibacter halocynthiae TaxID=1242689 RepID=UPI00248F5D33|nr:type VI secretion system membrane subunit TssM [Litoreibacter halocynthiae]